MSTTSSGRLLFSHRKIYNSPTVKVKTKRRRTNSSKVRLIALSAYEDEQKTTKGWNWSKYEYECDCELRRGEENCDEDERGGRGSGRDSSVSDIPTFWTISVGIWGAVKP